MLAAGTAAQVGFSAVGIGLPAIAPALRDEFGLSLAEVGIALSGVWVGASFTLLPWGLLADRIGERAVLVLGVGASGLGLAAAGFAPSFLTLMVLLALAGAAGSSVNAASGRAVMAWFPPEQRGLALGIRQTAIPVGGAAAALVLPAVEAAAGLEGAFLVLGAYCILSAVVGGLVVRERGTEPEPVGTAPWTMRDGRIWRLSGAGGLYLVAQIALISFVVLFLHDERGWSNGDAAAVLAAIQVLAVAFRVGAGIWSDRLRARIPPLQRIGVASFVTLVLVATLVDAPGAVLLTAIVLAGATSMAWNGLSFTAAAELAGHARSGAAIGIQQTSLSVAGLAIPIAFAAAVEATTWQIAFAAAALGPLAGVFVLRPLRER